jgi:hypothetical protein
MKTMSPETIPFGCFVGAVILIGIGMAKWPRPPAVVCNHSDSIPVTLRTIVYEDGRVMSYLEYPTGYVTTIRQHTKDLQEEQAKEYFKGYTFCIPTK